MPATMILYLPPPENLDAVAVVTGQGREFRYMAEQTHRLTFMPPTPHKCGPSRSSSTNPRALTQGTRPRASSPRRSLRPGRYGLRELRYLFHLTRLNPNQLDFGPRLL